MVEYSAKMGKIPLMMPEPCFCVLVLVSCLSVSVNISNFCLNVCVFASISLLVVYVFVLVSPFLLPFTLFHLPFPRPHLTVDSICLITADFNPYPKA
jgi:hypothetical protein